MSEEIQTAGTPPDGNAEATGTSGDGNAEDPKALQDRIAELENFKKQALAEKTNNEARARELEALKSQQAVAAAQTPPNAAVDPRLAALQQANSTLEYMASQGDSGAIWQLAVRNELQRQNSENQRLKELLTVPDARREQVDKMAREYGVTPKAAELMLDGMEYRQAKEKIRDEDERESKNAPRPVHTATVSVPASEANKTIYKLADYSALQNKLQEEGRTREASALRRKRESGEIQVLNS